MEESCRLCLDEDNVIVTDVFNSKGGYKIVAMIKDICSISIEANDPYSKIVCDVCLETLYKAYELRCLSLSNDRCLKEPSHTELVIVKLENDELIKYEPQLNSNDPGDLDTEEHVDDSYEIVDYTENLEFDMSGSFQCDQCPESRSAKEKIEKHIKSQHLKQNICDLCGKKLVSPAILKQHMKRQHMTEEQLKCSECGMILKSAKKLERHQLVHLFFVEEVDADSRKSFICRHCSKTFKSCNEPMFMHVYYHRKSLQEKESQSSLKRMREDTESLVCPHCGKIYRTKQILQQHIKRHFDAGDKYACPKCPQKFKSWSEIFYHSAVHTTERNFVCDICDKAFKAKRDLRNHKIRHETKDIKKFQCTYCQLRVKSKYALNRHIMIHTGEKNHVCEFCQKSFTQKNELNKHLRIHIGDNTYKCDFQSCKSAYRLLSELRLHKQSHYEKTVNE